MSLESDFKLYREEFNLLISNIAKDLSYVSDITTVNTEITKALMSSAYLPKFKRLFLKYIKKQFGKPTKWVLGKHLSNNLTLSQSVYNNVLLTKRVLRSEMIRLLKVKGNWNKVANSVYKQKLTKDAIPSYINRLVHYSTVLGVNSSEYKRSLIVATKNIENLSNERLKRAYSNLVSKTTMASKEVIEKAMERAIKAKAKYVAERLVRTEMASAYNETFLDNMNDAAAYQITLSSGHKVRDICNFHAEADQFGLGAGVVPSNYNSHIPFHPNCMCSMTKIYEIDKKPKFNNKAGKDFLKNNKDVLPKKDQSKINKVKNPEKLIPNYEKPEKK